MAVPRILGLFALLFALLLMALSPRGYMPVAADGTVGLVICSATGAADVDLGGYGPDAPRAPAGKGEVGAGLDCPFGLPPLAGPIDPPLLPHPLLLPLELRLVPLAPALVVRLASRLRPPAQAPPVPL